ncbi:HTH_Tnp_Tc3_2 domain-containing protein [Trichonephila clavipes]|nr:HTH_Tnp_Tc3_2 domain-containing protein [Trichonephila clavipes]
MPRVKDRNVYRHVSDFDKSRIVEYRDCGLSHRSIAACVGRDPMTITSSREDRRVTRMALTDHAATSRVLRQELGSFARQQVSARTVRRRFLQHRLSARIP